MDRLPPELCDRIASYVVPPKPHIRYVDPTERPRDDPPPRLSTLSTLSRGWQSSIERHVFRALSITNDDLDRIVTPWRRDYVRELHLTVNFPNYDDKLSKKYETNSERAVNNAIATSAVKRLFAVLGAWGADESLKLELHLDFTSPGDRIWGEGGLLRHRGIDEKRYEYSFVKLDGVEEFAEVPRVTMLYANHDTRPIELYSLYGLTSRLPRAICALWETEVAGPFTRLRREQRDRFILAVESIACRIPPILQVTIEPPECYQGKPLPNLATPYTYDRVSSAFRQLSIGLTEFRFVGIADDTLLWPSPAQAQIPKPYWENLTSLDIELSLQSPLGNWYFLSEDGNVPSDVPIPDDIPEFLPPGYYDSDESIKEEAIEYAKSLQRPVDHDGLMSGEDDFRTQPNDEAIVPLLAAFARAIGAMPSLRSAHLQFWNEGRRSPFYVAFAPPGGIAGDEHQLPEEERPPGTAPRLVAHTWEWRMDSEIEDLFRRAGAGIHGVETAVRYLVDQYGR